MEPLKITNPIDYKVALYIRLSKEDEKPGESESISNQRSMLLRFAKKERLYVVDEYVDDGISGTTFERPGFKRMIRDIENGNVNMVITKDLSRLGRDYIQTGYYLEKYFPENRVRYISILDNVDTGIESSSNDITPFKSILNDMYAKDISKKIKSSLRAKQKDGKWVGGRCSFGYMKDPAESEKVKISKALFSLFKYKNYRAYHAMQWANAFAWLGRMSTYLAAITVGSSKILEFSINICEFIF